jgi:hypothetical protein
VFVPGGDVVRFRQVFALGPGGLSDCYMPQDDNFQAQRTRPSRRVQGASSGVCIARGKGFRSTTNAGLISNVSLSPPIILSMSCYLLTRRRSVAALAASGWSN